MYVGRRRVVMTMCGEGRDEFWSGCMHGSRTHRKTKAWQLKLSYSWFEAEASLNNIQERSPYRKKNTTLHHYKDHLVNAVLGNNVASVV
jgi:hypothetical protein